MAKKRDWTVVKKGEILYKKCDRPSHSGAGMIVTLRVTKGGFCSSGSSRATSAKCRVAEAMVVAIRAYDAYGGKPCNCGARDCMVDQRYKIGSKRKKAVSLRDPSFVYEVGKIVKPTFKFAARYEGECASGIHGFRNIEDAKDWT